YPDSLVSAGLAGPASLPVRLWSAANRRLSRASRAIVVLGRDAVNRWGAYGGREKINVLPNYSEPEIIEPRPRSENPVLARLGLLDRLVFQYAGNMGRTHDIESLAAGIRLVKEQTPQAHFLFIGSGARRPLLEALSAEMPETVTVLDYQKRDGLNDVLNACDWALISQSRGMAGVSIPSRMYNVFCTGRPILAVAEAEAELSLNVAEHRLGRVIPPGSPEAFAQAVAEIAADPAGPEGVIERSWPWQTPPTSSPCWPAIVGCSTPWTECNDRSPPAWKRRQVDCPLYAKDGPHYGNHRSRRLVPGRAAPREGL
ncbi:MAG: glycosyltransferase family 4 protein, partial [Fimbriimonadaceae bacterium]|nr:glycosyltransferase family 4 protein [Fimbriimonadaceae bacterium]